MAPPIARRPGLPRKPRCSGLPSAAFPVVAGRYYAPTISSSSSRKRRAPISTTTPRRDYLDYLLGRGPMVLGHAHPRSSRPSRHRSAGNDLLSSPSPPWRWPRRSAACHAPSSCATPPRAARRRSSAARGTRLPQARQDPEVRRAASRHPRLLWMSVGRGRPRPPRATPDSAGIPRHGRRVLIAPSRLEETEAIIAAHHESLAA